MLWKTVGFTTGLVFALAVGCGGKAVIDGPNNNNTGGAGGSGEGGSAQMSSSSTGMPSCQGLEDCCQEACEKGGDVGLMCWPQNGSCGCQGIQVGPDCGDALADLFACAAAVDDFGYTCDNGAPVLKCGFCDSEGATVESACGTPQPCVDP